MTTTALRDGDVWVLNGTSIGLRAVVCLGEEGLEIGAREPTMGLRGIGETEAHVCNLRLPLAQLITPPEGTARGVFEAALEFVRKRKQFGRHIAEFQGTHWMLADISMQIDAARLMIWRAAMSAETQPASFPDPLLAAQVKIFTSEMAVKVTNDAMQLHGPRGYSRYFPVERMARDGRMFTVGGGTAQMLRNLVAGIVLDMKTPQNRDQYAKMIAKKYCGFNSPAQLH